MTTKEAFEVFLNDPFLVNLSGMTGSHKRVLRKKLKDGTINHDTMHPWLEKVGFTEKIEWRFPKGYEPKKAAVETAADQ